MARVYKTTYEDIYRFHAKYGHVPPLERQDKYWESLVDEIGEYSKAHADKFTTDLLVAVMNELEREYREANGYDEQER
jgi:hypothetical protein